MRSPPSWTGDGLRRSMTVNNGTGSATTDYLLDGQNVVQELNETNSGGVRTLTPIATYCSGPRGVEYREDASGRKWYIYDGLGSVVAEVDSGQSSTDGSVTVTATRAYNAYGAVRSSGGTSASNHKFCGQLGHTADDSTGLTYMRARYYDPAIGRFASEDPVGHGVNWYVYCGNNPVNATDPSGNMTLSDLLTGTTLQDTLEGALGDVSDWVFQKFCSKLQKIMWDWAVCEGLELYKDDIAITPGRDMVIDGWTTAKGAYRIMLHLDDAIEGPHIQLWFNAIKDNQKWVSLKDVMP